MGAAACGRLSLKWEVCVGSVGNCSRCNHERIHSIDELVDGNTRR